MAGAVDKLYKRSSKQIIFPIHKREIEDHTCTHARARTHTNTHTHTTPPPLIQGSPDKIMNPITSLYIVLRLRISRIFTFPYVSMAWYLSTKSILSTYMKYSVRRSKKGNILLIRLATYI
jgi:hypothetical protein